MKKYFTNSATSTAAMFAAVVFGITLFASQAASVQAAISLVQSTSTGSGASVTHLNLVLKNASSSHFIGVVVTGSGAAAAAVPTDNLHDTFKTAIKDATTTAGGCASVTACRISVFYLENLPTSGNLTVNVSSTGAAREFHLGLFEYSGVATSSSLDATSTKIGTGTPTNSGNITTTGSGDLLLGVDTNDSGANPEAFTGRNGFTVRQSQTNGSLYTVWAAQDRIATSTITASSSMTITSGSWVDVVAAFKAVASSSPDTTPPSVAWVAPANNATVSSTITLTASSTDNIGVAKVAFYEAPSGVGFASSTLVGSSTTPTGTLYSTSWNTTGAANGTTTLWAFSTDTSNNTSTASIAVTVSNAQNPPTINSFSASPSIVALAGTSTLSWNVVNASSVAITPGSFTSGSLVDSTTVNPTSTTTYTLTATNANGTSTADATVTVDSSAPSTPTDLVASSTSASQIDLSWASSTDTGGSGLAGYNIFRCTGDPCTPATLIASSSALTYNDSGLVSSTTYTYAISAFDGVGNVSATSTTASSTTQAGGGSGGNSYTTSFPNTENPISESGNWVNGGQPPANNWTNVQTTPGLAFGTMDVATSTDDDSTALLTGTWGPNQTVMANVHAVGNYANGQEVELRLHSAFATSSCTGYELDIAAGYIAIVRWNGPIDNFTALKSNTSATWSLPSSTVEGTINTSGTIKIFVNGVLEASATDTTYATGTPGMGFFISQNGDPTKSDMGFTSYSATDH